MHRAIADPGKRHVADALRALAPADTRNLTVDGRPALVSAFVTRTRERIDALLTPMAALIVVIEGVKEVAAGGERLTHVAGEAFVLPAGARVDVVNEPDPASGVYRALCVCFPRELVIEAARRWPRFVGRGGASGVRPVTVTADLCSAILHAAEALSAAIPASGRLTDHRILEILLLLAEQGVLPLTPKYVDGSVAEAVRLLVRHRLHLDWTAAGVAKALDMSEATLRRRLRAEATTFQDLLRDERMAAAYLVLNERDADVAEALAATGYRSRSHFARHFQARFGATPAAVRQGRRADG